MAYLASFCNFWKNEDGFSFLGFFSKKMPNYDFECAKCGFNFWKSVSLGTTEISCEQCHGVAKKVFSAPAVHFSGEGFYQTDARKKEKEPCRVSSEKKSE